MIISNVQRMLDAVPMITQGYDSLKSVSEILYAGDLERNGTALLPSPVQGGIEFRQVTFGYAEDQEPVLKEISFSVPPRGSIAFVGKSGEGKTTILNLILGLYSPREGEVLIDGVNLETLEKTAYRHHIAVVPQQTVLFSGRLWDNLVYGLNYVSTETVMDVIRRVGLEDLVESLPEGLNTPILESGGNLSGGQRQRISIARALLRKPKIILLDEATSALDTASEQQVQEAIDAMMGSCTVIMVAHRLNTLRRAEIICRIDRGRISRYEDFEQVIRDMEGEDAV
jgi:ATP-binding cassette subfamily B protein